MKKVISLVLALALCLGMCAFADTSAQTADIPLKLIADNKVIDTKTVVINERTLVPLRALMESMNATVVWNEDRSIDVTKGDKSIRVQIDNYTMTTPAGSVTLDVAPMLEGGTTTYVPIRAVSEEFDFTVEWDQGTKTVLILSPDGDHYVDLYGGVTLKDYLPSLGMTEESFTVNTGLNYEEHKDKTFCTVENLLPLSYIANSNAMGVDEVKQLIGLGDDIDENTPWGKALGEITLGAYISAFTPVLSYGMTMEEAVDYFREVYGLGSEYTAETKYKFVRTIADNIEKKAMEEEKLRQEEEAKSRAQDLELLPELLKKTIGFEIVLADGSVMKGELYPELAPKTVANFVSLAEAKFYDGLIFHRVIDGFMIQGGGYDKNFNEKEADPIEGEFYDNGFINALKHEKGVISMARTNDPNSAASQFFIMDESAPHLDGSYAAFGKITQGLDVVEKISAVKTKTHENGMADVPEKTVQIKTIRIKK